MPALRISGASLRGRDGRVLLDNLTLDVAPGEIVGLAGVEGNGQRVLGDVLASLLALDEGRSRWTAERWRPAGPVPWPRPGWP